MHKQLKLFFYVLEARSIGKTKKTTQINTGGCFNIVLKMEWVEKLVIKHSNQNLYSVSIYNITFIFSILIPSPPPIADAAAFTFN